MLIIYTITEEELETAAYGKDTSIIHHLLKTQTLSITTIKRRLHSSLTFSGTLSYIHMIRGLVVCTLLGIFEK
jgi:hypothetical protein